MKSKDKITVIICALIISLCGGYLIKTEIFESRSFHRTVNKIKIGHTYNEVEDILNQGSINFKRRNENIITAIFPRKFSYGVLKVEFDKDMKDSEILIK